MSAEYGARPGSVQVTRVALDWPVPGRTVHKDGWWWSCDGVALSRIVAIRHM